MAPIKHPRLSWEGHPSMPLRLVYSRKGTTESTRSKLNSIACKALPMNSSTSSPPLVQKVRQLLDVDPSAAAVIERLIDERLRRMSG
jgi:hypothetical protein